MTTAELPFEDIEQRSVHEFSEKSYLDYAMYVILDRALPHIGDGLKPVQRRIVYAMSELGLNAGAKFKKSARTVGDVLGKFHPHGDAACYEAMVLMAQSFSYRYPLIDGQGNWGSADDPKSFAAMRYTESRLTPYAEVLLGELGQGTVEWGPNFDGTLDEPLLLPARLPNVLLNGGMGIAVGMSTDIPPHNLIEVASACIRLLEAPRSTVADLLEHIKGPDYPTEAEIITPQADLVNMYTTGVGSVRLRARWEKEGSDIVITALPYQVSGARILEQIAQQMNAKKLPMVEDLRDESDHETPTRLVIIPRSNRVDAESLIQHLFATTDMERNYRVNLNVIGTNGRPQVKDLKTLLSEWILFRTDTVRRRLQWHLEKVNKRLEILDGLLIAFLNIDEVIRIVRNEDEPKSALMQQFRLTDPQAEAILDLKLRHLAKLEEVKIRGEQQDLAGERQGLDKTLASKTRLKTLVRNELKADAEKFGDKRRSPLNPAEVAKAFDETQLIPSEPVTVVLSEKGWVRSARGHEVDGETLNYKGGDSWLASAMGRSNQQAVFLDSTGRSYSLPAHTLPSARSLGEPVSGRFSPPSGATFHSVMCGDPDELFLLSSDAGYGFVARLGDLYAKNKAGKSVLSLPRGARVLGADALQDMATDQVAAVTTAGRLLVIEVADLPMLARGKGLKIINIPSKRVIAREEYMVDIAVLPEGAELLVYSGKRHLRLKGSDLKHFAGQRGRRGMKLPRGFQRVDSLSVEYLG